MNANDAEIRAAQCLRSYCDPGYQVEPPFEDWDIDRGDRVPGSAPCHGNRSAELAVSAAAERSPGRLNRPMHELRRTTAAIASSPRWLAAVRRTA